MVVHFGPHAPPGPWLAFEIARAPERAIASVDYLERRGTPTRVEDLAGHDLLAWAAPGEDGRVWPMLAGGVIEVEPVLVTADVHMIRQCVIAGAGIGFVPDGMLPDPGVPVGTIVPVLAEVIGRKRSLCVAVPTALAELPKLRAMLRHLRAFAEQIAALPP
jgi:DNA-binding transcriptional LysR family regulator